mmetsp:Transcript_5207/g.7824  ORF Transcript_5207/g.7824 Transcript_5207/m.7824 type:complete len:135 (-) Transcript_5207:111-515(-)
MGAEKKEKKTLARKSKAADLTSLSGCFLPETVTFKSSEWKKREKKTRAWKNLKQVLVVEATLSDSFPSYQSIQATPSLLPKKKYCDITGMQANYTDPRTGLRYSCVDVYHVISDMPSENVQRVLALRNANVSIR